MPLGKVLSVADAVALIRDGDALATTGYGGNGTPDQLFIHNSNDASWTPARPAGSPSSTPAARATGRSAASTTSVTRAC